MNSLIPTPACGPPRLFKQDVFRWRLDPVSLHICARGDEQPFRPFLFSREVFISIARNETSLHEGQLTQTFRSSDQVTNQMCRIGIKPNIPGAPVKSGKVFLKKLRVCAACKHLLKWLGIFVNQNTDFAPLSAARSCFLGDDYRRMNVCVL